MSKFFQIKKKNVFVFFLVLAMFFYIPSFVEARVDCSPAPLGTIGGATSCGFHSDGVIRYDDPHLAASTESIDALVPCSNKCAEDDFGCQWTGTSGNIKCWSTDDFIVGNSCDYSHLWSGDGVVNEHGYCVFPCSDTDGDGYGYPASSLCNYPEGDCDDSDSDINPSASEVCNNIDDDCVNGVDDGLSNCQCTYDAPSDENCDGIDNNCDGVIDSPDCVCGSLDLEFCQCENDAQPTTEVCDNVDNDCDGYIDEYPCSKITYYFDDECGTGHSSNTWDNVCKVDDTSGIRYYSYNNRGSITRDVRINRFINVVSNPSFEIMENSFPLAWHSSGSISVVSADCKYDLNCINLGGNGATIISDFIPVDSSKNYFVSATFKDSSDQKIKLNFFNLNKDLISEYNMITNIVATEWTRFSKRIYSQESLNTPRFPLGTVYVKVVLGGGSNSAKIDGVQLEEVFPSGFLDNTASVVYELDTLNRIKKIILPNNKEIEYFTNSLGFIESIYYDNQRLLAYSYYPTGRVSSEMYYPIDVLGVFSYYSGTQIMKSERYSQSGVSLFERFYEYDNIRNLAVVRQGTTAGSPMLFSYLYDDLDRLTRVEDYQKVLDPVSGDISYTYDLRGNRETRTESSQTTTYNYAEGNNKLLSLNSESNFKYYNYDDGYVISASETNLLANPGFESGVGAWKQSSDVRAKNWQTTHWGVGGNQFVLDNNLENVFDGFQSLRMENFVGSNTYIYQDLDVETNTNYVLSGWVKNFNTDGSGTGVGIWKTDFTDSGISPYYAKISAGTHDWERVSFTFYSGSNTRLRIACFTWDATKGSAWCDDLQLEKGTTATDFDSTSYVYYPNKLLSKVVYSKNDIGYDLNNYVNYYYDDLGRKIIREDFFNVTFIYYYLSGEVLFETSFEKCSFEPKSPGIRIQKGEDVLAYIDGSGGVLLKGDLFQQQTIPTDIDGFAIEDSVGKKIALFDNQGNLHLAGSYIPFVGLSRSSDKEFVVRSPDVFGTVNDVLIIDNTGNLRTILCVRSNTEFSLT